MNSKLREQGKKEEKRRLKEFVENAYRCDPRVIAHKEAQRAERCASVLAHSYWTVPEICKVSIWTAERVRRLLVCCSSCSGGLL